MSLLRSIGAAVLQHELVDLELSVLAAQEPDRERFAIGSFTDGMPDVALIEVDFPGLGKVEVFGPGVTIVDDEFYFNP